MRWQKRLRLAIAVFVVLFAAVVAVSLRRGRSNAAPAAAITKKDPVAIYQGGAGDVRREEHGKIAFSMKFGTQATYDDGRSKFGGGVTVVLPDRNGRQITIASQDAEVTVPPDKKEGTIGTALFSGGVKLTTSDGVVVSSPTATYKEEDQIARIPGPLTFQKGRMTGSGVGATYDQNRSVLWILDRAKVDVTPDKQGAGAVHAVAKSAGMARADHYMKFIGAAELSGEGHVATGDEITAFLTEDDERMTRMELRGSARIQGTPGSSGPQDMRAKDIDLSYAGDGRTLQSAHLAENASVQLPGEKGKTGRRVGARVIDVALGPDGSTVTNLAANENAQVDLPADGDTPARRIRSASLLATGPATASGQTPAGIQAATFSGDVEYRETRPARGKLPAVDRTARSARMDVKTKPGFGDIEQATFHTNVHFTDGTQTTADSPTAVYQIAQDRLDLSAETGDTGHPPHVSDGRISVEARTIQMTLSTQAMKADTRVRSLMTPQKKDARTPQGGSDVRVPSIMKQDQPVNVTSNRLNYDGANSVATYEGGAKLWQDDTEIKADRIVLEDKTGNLHATTNVITTMTMSNADAPSAEKGQPTTTKADELLYEDGRHRATYTGSAHMNGPSGDLTADRIELYLAEQGGQLERVEADSNVVSRQELRRAYGRHLTYLAKDDMYRMTGAPVKVYDDTPGNCTVTEGAIATFSGAGKTAPDGQAKVATSSVIGSEAFPHKSGTSVCGAGPGSL